MAKNTAIVWFDADLRVTDHPALHRAAAEYSTVIPVFIRDPTALSDWSRGRTSRWWTARSLEAIEERLNRDDLQLVTRRGPPADQLPALVASTGADAVLWNRRLHPERRRRAEAAADALAGRAEVRTPAAGLLHDPEAVETTSGGPYQVYTPFWKKFREVVDVEAPLGEPALEQLTPPGDWPRSDSLEELGLEAAAPPEATRLKDWWDVGEPAARRRLETFVDTNLADYDELRDRPDLDGTSRLSPHLACGEISPRRVWQAVRRAPAADTEGAETYLQEIVWREFAYHLLHHYPETVDTPLREKFEAFPWHDAPDAYARWCQGQTGYPIVDAGMRQLRETGWMHNRVRMIVASFLSKDLMIPWQRGARWFWEHLVDADLANNTMGWQWAAGCGADAQPFFRIFNPVSQGERHDPDGDYVRRFVPELNGLPAEHIHQPWAAGGEVLRAADLELGTDYPEPIVDHGEARSRALEAWETIK